MTLPFERSRSVLQTREFLLSLVSGDETPKHIREHAHRLLRHYPSATDIRMAHNLEVTGSDGVFGPVFGANGDDPG
jgi:hypothetical protein